MESKYFKNINSYNSYICKNDKNFFNILSVNIRSVSSINKFNRFKNEISQLKKLPEVIAIQETWFSSQCLSLYYIGGYNAIHCNRKDGFGGTTMFVNSKLAHKVILKKSEDNLDAIVIELPGIWLNNSSLVVLSIYRSPRCKTNTFLNKMDGIMRELGSYPTILVGDVNVDLLVENRSQRLLLDFLSEFDMRSCHEHITRPCSNTCIDWIFSNNSNRLFVHSVENMFSDHNILSCGVCLDVELDENIIECKKTVKYEKFARILDDTLESIDNIAGDSDLCEKFMRILTSAASQSTEITSKSVNIRTRITPWMTESLHSLIQYKNKLLKVRRSNRNKPGINEQLKRIGNVIKICNKKLMHQYYIYNLEQCGSDVRKTWQFLNKELGRNNKPQNEMITEDGNCVVEDGEKATALNTYFYESITKLKNSIPHSSNDDINIFGTLVPARSVFNLARISNVEVINQIDSLKLKKSSGYDDITPKMLVIRKELIAEIFVPIFNNMIEDRKYPDVLKIHKVTPIPKIVGSKNVSDFRPVAVLSVIDKIIEKIISEQLTNYLYEKNLLYEYQFGFTKGSGTEEALVYVLDFVCGGIDAGYKGVAGVFYDFSKAFDLVDHDILVRKLRNIGVADETMLLFKDYLRGRLQYVQVGDSKSSMLPVNHGVPQGSVLGPLFFKIYINDLKNIIFYGKLIMFADDICLFYKYADEKVLQTQIEYDAAILSEFARVNKLVLNSAKTKFMRFKPQKSRNDGEMIVHIDGTAVSESENVKYLGINLSHNLLWDVHIAEVKAKISSATGVLYKFKNKLNTEAKWMIYQSLVHSHLTYLPLIYGCRVNRSLKSLQSAQNKALKTVYNLPIRYPSIHLYKYKAQHILPVRGLYKQRLLLYMFKSVRGIGSRSVSFNQNVTRTGRSTRQAENLHISRCRLDLTKQRIGFAGPREYNNLPINLRNISAVSSFKLQLKSFLLENLETLLM